MGAGTTMVKHFQLFGYALCNSDENIEKPTEISDLFSKGEDYFRNIETKMIQSMATLDGVIMSTGGGVILRPENMKALKEKGVIFYIKRSVEDILKTVEAETRPLLKNNPDALYRISEERNFYIISTGLCYRRI